MRLLKASSIKSLKLKGRRELGVCMFVGNAFLEMHSKQKGLGLSLKNRGEKRIFVTKPDLIELFSNMRTRYSSIYKVFKNLEHLFKIKNIYGKGYEFVFEQPFKDALCKGFTTTHNCNWKLLLGDNNNNLLIFLAANQNKKSQMSRKRISKLSNIPSSNLQKPLEQLMSKHLLEKVSKGFYLLKYYFKKLYPSRVKTPKKIDPPSTEWIPIPSLEKLTVNIGQNLNC